MASRSFKAFAPGSFMLMGEHAVLRGYPALVMAVEQGITVTLTPRADRVIQIASSLGQHQTTLDDLQVKRPFQFVLALIQHLQTEVPQGFDLVIYSDIRADMGIGSSAAVTMATLKVFVEWLQLNWEQTQLLSVARQVVRSQQNGLGSGADLAASLLGGTVYFHAEPLSAQRLSHTPKIISRYCGYKTPTAEVIQRVEQQRQAQPAQYAAYDQQIGQLVEQAKQAIEQADWRVLGQCFIQQQAIMHAMQLCTPEIDALLAELTQDPQVLGAKISGSGLGDCVIGLLA